MRWFLTHGFDLNAGLHVPAGQQDHLERVCRYPLRPPIAHDRLHLTAGGLTPRPHINVILYHGVLAPRAAWRSLLVRCGATSSPGEATGAGASSDQSVANANRPHRAGGG